MYRYHQNLMSSSAFTSSSYCYQVSRNESGRSMIEILGVLAIIGILSVGGLALFKTATGKYRSNELMSEISARAAVVAMKKSRGHSHLENALGKLGGGRYGVTTTGLTRKFGITVDGVDKVVCDNIKRDIGENTPLRYIALKNNPAQKIDNCQEGKADYAFVYNDDFKAVSFVFNDDEPVEPLPEGNCSNCRNMCSDAFYYDNDGAAHACGFGCEGPDICRVGCLGGYYYSGNGDFWRDDNCATVTDCLYASSCYGCNETGYCQPGCFDGVYIHNNGYQVTCQLGCDNAHRICRPGCVGGIYFNEYGQAQGHFGCAPDQPQHRNECINDVYYDYGGMAHTCGLGCAGNICQEGCSGGHYYDAVGNHFYMDSCAASVSGTYQSSCAYVNGVGAFYSDDGYSYICSRGCENGMCATFCEFDTYYNEYGASVYPDPACADAYMNQNGNYAEYRDVCMSEAYFDHTGASHVCWFGCDEYGQYCRTGCTGGNFYSSNGDVLDNVYFCK